MQYQVNKKISIIQPHFLPYIGYFDLISKSDLFIFLDSVQYDHRSWQQRNKIKTNLGEEFITMPVMNKKLSKQKLKDVRIFEKKKNFNKILNKIHHAYSKAKFYHHFIDDIKGIFENYDDEFLCNLNILLIKYFMKIFSIDTKIAYSSLYDVKYKRDKLLAEICTINNCNTYISNVGSRVGDGTV